MKTMYFISECGKKSYAINKTLRIRSFKKDNSIKEVTIKTNINKTIEYLNNKYSFNECKMYQFLAISKT